MSAACERDPHETRVTLNKDALRIREASRRVIDLGQAGVRWIGSWMNPDNFSGILVGPQPYRAVDRARPNTIRVHSNPFVLPRHERLIGLDPARVRSSVPVRIKNERAPALGFGRVMGLVERVGVDIPNRVCAQPAEP